MSSQKENQGLYHPVNPRQEMLPGNYDFMTNFSYKPINHREIKRLSFPKIEPGQQELTIINRPREKEKVNVPPLPLTGAKFAFKDITNIQYLNQTAASRYMNYSPVSLVKEPNSYNNSAQKIAPNSCNTSGQKVMPNSFNTSGQKITANSCNMSAQKPNPVASKTVKQLSPQFEADLIRDVRLRQQVRNILEPLNVENQRKVANFVERWFPETKVDELQININKIVQEKNALLQKIANRKKVLEIEDRQNIERRQKILENDEIIKNKNSYIAHLEKKMCKMQQTTFVDTSKEGSTLEQLMRELTEKTQQVNLATDELLNQKTHNNSLFNKYMDLKSTKELAPLDSETLKAKVAVMRRLSTEPEEVFVGQSPREVKEVGTDNSVESESYMRQSISETMNIEEQKRKLREFYQEKVNASEERCKSIQDRINAIDHERDAYLCTIRLKKLEEEKVKVLESEPTEQLKQDGSEFVKLGGLEIITENILGESERLEGQSSHKKQIKDYSSTVPVVEDFNFSEIQKEKTLGAQATDNFEGSKTDD